MDEKELEYYTGLVKSRLEAYRELDREIENQIERLERLLSKMTSVQSPDLSGMPRNPSAPKDRMTAMVARKDELTASVMDSIHKRDKEKAEIEEMLMLIKSSEERAVIRMRYFDGERWKDISDMLYRQQDDYDERQESYLRRVFYVHKEAIQHLATITAGKVQGSFLP